uniref:C-type lectin domain-containing protein n=1 Tax=Oryzias latipes TaxID=8090 RepID=A0A3B3H8D0_ORYLA
TTDFPLHFKDCIGVDTPTAGGLRAACLCQKCPKNWIESKESCYFFYNLDSYKAWNDSREFCQNMKSDLVVISTGIWRKTV